MGGSDRPQCSRRPIRGTTEYTTSWCDSRYTPSQAVSFFVDPFHEWMQQSVLDRSNSSLGKVVLVGHSLGGYLSARYVLEHPSIVNKLILASPVGFPQKPSSVLTGSQLPTSMRIVDALWSSNLTPQQLVRMMGSTRGRANTKRVLQGRIQNLRNSTQDLDLLAEYLYHITVADPSGEFAMNSLLEPAVSPELMGVFAREPLDGRLSELETSTDSAVEDIKIIFGDHDWMRPNEVSARNTVAKMKSIRTSVDIVPQAGHHLYYDNARDFERHILS